MIRRACINQRFGCGRTFRLDRVGDAKIIVCRPCWKRADPILRMRSRDANRAFRACNHKSARLRYPSVAAWARAGTALWIDAQNAFLAVILDSRAKLAMGAPR